MDKSSIIGLILGIGGILLGNALEEGHLGSLIQLTAALIVFGGTFGATLLSNTKEDFRTGLSLLKIAFQKRDNEYHQKVAKEIIESSKIARKESILALDKKIQNYSDPFMKNVFRFMADGVEAPVLREVFEAEVDLEEKKLFSGAKIWLDAGGFSPTIGIIGAVLGLIHVMANLTDTSQLGKGIAVAFVATIYGVGAANLIFIPLGNKIKNKVSQSLELKEMIIDGAVAIIKNHPPYVIEEKIYAYLESSSQKK